MGILCCFSAPATADEDEKPVIDVRSKDVADAEARRASGALAEQNATLPRTSAPTAAGSSSRDVDKPWSKLNENESAAVKQTLLKVSELIERFAEGSAEREAPLHALKKALQLVAADCHASYASMSVVSTDQSNFLVMGAVGSSHEATTIPNTIKAVKGSGSSVERIMNGQPLQPMQQQQQRQSTGRGSDSSDSSSNQPLHWSQEEGLAPPSDWVALQCAGIRHIHAMPIRASPSSLLAVLNLGFKHEPCLDMGFMGPHLFSTYLSLVSATLTAVVRDPGLNAYVCLARDLAAATCLDNIMQAALLGSRAALTRLKGMAAAGSHTWLRLALISGDKSAAALFDDLSLAGVARGNTKTRSASGPGASTNAQWVATIQAAGGLVRTNIPMKNTILRIALTNKKQVLIPDVQKLINQLGNVNTDLFASRLLRPPSSVLLLPLRASGVGIFGALYCLADVHTEFSEVAKQLKEVAELLGQGLNRQLSGPLLHEYLGIQQMNHEQLLQRDGGDGSHGSFGLGGPMGLTGSMGLSHHSSGGISPSTVTPATTAGSLPGAHCSYSTTGSSSMAGGAGGGPRSEGSFMAAATAGGALELGSTVCTHASWAGSAGGSFTSGGSFTAQGSIMGRSFVARQVASSTNAVATGITEKLNQKRINAAMSEPEEEQLGALQLVAQIGEGGFAKVFRGLYRGLVVAVKVVSVGDPSNERAVMKNAHEIAILRSSSHPNIIQAYSCMTDVQIRDVIALCTRHAPQKQRMDLVAALSACAGSTARPPSAGGKQQQGGGGGGSSASSMQQQQQFPEDATCHIEVVEYCDMGNLTTAIRNHIFSLEYNNAALSAAAAAQARSSTRSGGGRSRSSAASGHYSSGGSMDDGADGSTDGSLGAGGVGPLAHQASTGGASNSSSGSRSARLRLNMRWLLLTLLEVAEGMAYLHRMGVVHCDLKPANVLLKSSNADVRGFTAKVSDFGLSRVEDDDTCATFPFNSCGTAAYVAPEALITTKKVNASVDVYAFGIMMWELFVGQRPYGNMTQQKVVEEVVLRGLRPSFPVGTPLGYTQLACSCWHATAGQRPSFQEIVGRLQAMLHQAEDSAAAAAVSVSLTGSEAWGGRADGLGIPSVGGAGAAGGMHNNNAGLPPVGGGGGASGGGGNRGMANPNTPAAAAAIAEAAAAWQQHHQQQQQAGMAFQQQLQLQQQQQAAQGQVPAAQLLAWQQQQAALTQLQQHQHQMMAAGGGEDIGRAGSATPGGGGGDGGDVGRRSHSMGAASFQQQAAAAAALAAAGSVYEFQQVGFGGESVVGTGLVGAGSRGMGAAAAAAGRRRRPSNGSSYAGGASSAGGSSLGQASQQSSGHYMYSPGPLSPAAAQQQMWLAAAGAAAGRSARRGSFDAGMLAGHDQWGGAMGMGMGPAAVAAAAAAATSRQHRAPTRSKTFTAGSTSAQQQQQQQQHQLNQLMSQMGLLPGQQQQQQQVQQHTGSISRSTTGNTVASSVSFGEYATASTGSNIAAAAAAAGEDAGTWQQQQQLLLQQHHQMLLQRQAHAAVEQQQLMQQQQQQGVGRPSGSFTFQQQQQSAGPRAGSNAAAAAAAAIAAAQQKQQQQQQQQQLAMQAAGGASSSSAQPGQE